MHPLEDYRTREHRPAGTNEFRKNAEDESLARLMELRGRIGGIQLHTKSGVAAYTARVRLTDEEMSDYNLSRDTVGFAQNSFCARVLNLLSHRE